jgi:hypothetical protein
MSSVLATQHREVDRNHLESLNFSTLGFLQLSPTLRALSRPYPSNTLIDLKCPGLSGEAWRGLRPVRTSKRIVSCEP